MGYQITTIDPETGGYYPWLYRASLAVEDRKLTHGETSEECFTNSYKCKLVCYGTAIIALEFPNEADAVMFKLKWV